MRVLLFAHYPEPTQLQAPEGEARLPHGLIPLGTVSSRDTLRPEARETLAGLSGTNQWMSGVVKMFSRVPVLR